MKTQTPDTPLLFSFAFRSLFLLVVAQALVHISLWYFIWNGMLPFQWQISPTYWHGHEMIIGFAGAAIAGFLLTAVATWTGRKPVKGWPLVVLGLSWLVARTGLLYPLIAAIAGIFFWFWLWLLMAREVISAGNRRNYKVLLVLFIFLILEILFQFSIITQTTWQQSILWMQVWLVVILINLIGGRVIPAFTRNWLRMHNPQLLDEQLPAAFGMVDSVATIALVVFALSTLLPVPGPTLIVLAIATSCLQLWRLLRWKGYRTLANPLVWMLHLSYAWIPLGLLLFACGTAGIFPVSAGIHALTIGTIAGMIISMSSRAALGHTGRPLTAHPLLTTAIVMLTLAAVSRVLAAIMPDSLFISIATLFWLTAFICFAIRYIPVLLLPKSS